MELERQLNAKKATISAQKALEIAKNIYKIKAIKPKTGTAIEKVLLLNDKQKYWAHLFEF